MSRRIPSQKSTSAAISATRVTAYRVISRAYFHLPILVVFLVLEGFEAATIGILLALHGVVVAAGSRPLVNVTSRLSLLGALMVGEMVKVLGYLLFLLPTSLASVAAAQVLVGVGFVLTGGTDAALASTLRRGEAYRSQEASVQAGMFIFSFVAGLVGALVFGWWSRLPFVLSGVAALGAVLIIAPQGPWLRRPDVVASAPVSAAVALEHPRNTRSRRSQGLVVFGILYYSLTRAVLLSAYTFLLPLLLYSGYRLPVYMFGAVLGIYTVFGLVASRLSLGMTRRLSPSGFVYVGGGVTLSALALLARDSVAMTLLGLAFLGLAGGLARPATMMLVRPAVEGLADEARQHLLHGLERWQGLFQATLLLLSSFWLGDASGPKATLTGYAVFALVFQAVAMLLAAFVVRGEVLRVK